MPTAVDDFLVRLASRQILTFVIMPLAVLAPVFCVFDHFSPISSIVFAVEMTALAATIALYGYLDDRLGLGLLGAGSALLAALWFIFTTHWGLGHALLTYRLPFEGASWLSFRLVVDIVPPVLAMGILWYLITGTKLTTSLQSA